MYTKLLFQLLFLVLILSLASCDSANQSDDAGKEEAAAAEADNTETAFGGLALYTLRDTLATHPKQILREVAELGYAYIEAAGYQDGKFYGMAPAEFKSYVAEVGLEPVSSHHGDVTLDNADQMIADVKAAGFKYFVIPVPPMGHFKYDRQTQAISMSEDVEEIVAILNAIAQKCTAAGLACLYHNHAFEFEQTSTGIIPMDYFIENTDPEHLNFQLDLYWTATAGVDPIAYFNKAPGRFKSWHVKDMDEQGRFAPVGTGTIDFSNILKYKELSGMEYYFVEQDMTFGQTPMEAIRISKEGIEEIGFE